ncbi:hypothetical protein Tco_0679465 [Tanacetum coccineum]|uniref:Uncharacterized protein n=1 Tax=Tanacetum coccineum TaxID=301880 RepID=A0ABQ4XI06_9ASTR
MGQNQKSKIQAQIQDDAQVDMQISDPYMMKSQWLSHPILGKLGGQPLKNQSVVRQPTAFKSERPRISKPRFASQVNVNNDLSKPVNTHHLPKDNTNLKNQCEIKQALNVSAADQARLHGSDVLSQQFRPRSSSRRLLIITVTDSRISRLQQ